MFTFGREKARIRRRTIALYAVSMMLCLVAALIYVYPSIQSTNLMYDYSDRMRKLEALKDLNKKMKLELSSLRSYDYIEKKAVERLGYVFPEPEQVVIIAKK